MTEVRPFGAAAADNKKDESVPESGLVRNVCRQWVVHEDEGLAHRMQENEFRSHFGRNKEQHRTVQGDIKEAKRTQHEELSELETRHARHVEQLRKLEERDRVLAEQMQKTILQEEAEILHRRRHRDQMLALELQEEERLRSAAGPRQASALPRSIPNQDIIFQRDMPRGLEDRNTALDVMICEAPVRPQRRPAAALREENRRQQEILDEELARRLQEEERQATIAQQDHRLAVESQDAEYARVLQEKEKERLRKAKEQQNASPTASNSGDLSPRARAGRDNTVVGQVPPITPVTDQRLPHQFGEYYDESPRSTDALRKVQSLDPDARRFRNEPSNQMSTNIGAVTDPAHRSNQKPISMRQSPELPSTRNFGLGPIETSTGDEDRYRQAQDNDSPSVPVNGQKSVQSSDKSQRPRNSRGAVDQHGDKNLKEKDNCKNQ